MRFWPSWFLVGILTGWMCATSAAAAQAPRMDTIDPPGWWAGLPDPMLLVHGEALHHAQFTVAGSGVTLDHAQTSANGHWAFLWLKTNSAAPQTLWITARNHDGQARSAYALAARAHVDEHLGFSPADVLYLLMPDRFAGSNPAHNPPGDNRAAVRGWHGGNLPGIEQHLDYLQQLGVTALWTTPVVSNAHMRESYHGYAATNLYAIDPHFGTLADYQHLSAALHARGMKLIFDFVPNHIGIAHPWVNDPPAPDWLHGTAAHHPAFSSDFYQLVNPHAPQRAWINVTHGWFTDDMPDLNQSNPLVERYLIDNAIWWVETADIDGIRLDTFPYVDRAFWHDFHAELHRVYPHLTTVGEIYDRDPEVTSFFAGGVVRNGIDTGLDTPFDFPACFTLRDVLGHDKPMTELAKVLRQDALYPHPERLAVFIGNHDTSRFLTEAGGSGPRLKLALGLLATLRGMPQIYYGDEIGMAGGDDPDNRHDFPGGFAGDTHDAFTAAGRTPAEQSIFAWTSGMLALRHAHSALQTGLEQDLFADNDTFVFVRTPDAAGCSASHTERMLIVVNKSAASKLIDLPMDGTALEGCARFDAAAPAVGAAPINNNGKLHIDASAESLTVYTVR